MESNMQQLRGGVGVGAGDLEKHKECKEQKVSLT